jgi:hypothetical protein
MDIGIISISSATYCNDQTAEFRPFLSFKALVLGSSPSPLTKVFYNQQLTRACLATCAMKGRLSFRWTSQLIQVTRCDVSSKVETHFVRHTGIRIRHIAIGILLYYFAIG